MFCVSGRAVVLIFFLAGSLLALGTRCNEEIRANRIMAENARMSIAQRQVQHDMVDRMSYDKVPVLAMCVTPSVGPILHSDSG